MKNIQIQFNSDISKDNEEVRIAFYANIGFFIEVAQMLEFNLRKLLCYEFAVLEIEKSEITKENVESICNCYDDYYMKTYNDKWTLGQLINEVKKLKDIIEKIIEQIKEINNFRASIVHKIFQNNIVSNEFGSARYVLDYTNLRLIPMTDKALELNSLIIRIIETYKETLQGYKRQVGLS